MRILQIAPLWESVPPRGYGGTEAVVHLLVEELVRRGHEVTLCASGDSLTSARLRACYPEALRRTKGIEDKLPYAWMHGALALEDAHEFDVIHNHAGEEVMALAHLVGTPMLTTTHCNVTADRKFVWDHYDGYYNTISWSQRRCFPEVHRPRFAGVAHNAIDVPSFPFQREKGDHLLFLSRISPEKGPHIAIEVAKRTGRRLLIAGKVDDADYNFFLTAIAPQLDGDRIVFLGEADATRKRELYREAACVLAPIVWDEPFGLVLAEGQACGTPVVTFNRGAAPEIVRHGETGFVEETVDGMVQAVGRLKEIDPQACRDWVQWEFNPARITDRYVEKYEAIVYTSRTRPAPADFLTAGVEKQSAQLSGDRVA